MPPRVVQTVQPKPAAVTKPVVNAGSNGWGTPYYRVIVYGESGHGKTSFAGTFPGRGMWIQSNTKMSGSELISIDTPENRERITPECITTADQTNELIAKAAAAKMDFVVLDHITGLRDRFLAEVLGLEDIPVQKRWGMATQPQYGEAAEKVKTVVAKLCELPCHVVIIAQQGDQNKKTDAVVDSEIIQPLLGPAITPAIREFVYPLMPYIVQAFRRPRFKEETELMIPGDPSTAVTKKVRGVGVDFCLRVGYHDLYHTKFRKSRWDNYLPDAIVNPTFEKFQAVIDGTYLETYGE
jgi:hypothetical protein